MTADANTNTTDNQSDIQDLKTEGETGKGQNQSTSQPPKAQKSRHRASVACASCRDRRIRVCLFDISQVSLLICGSASYLQAKKSAHNANDQASTVSLKTMTNGDGTYACFWPATSLRRCRPISRAYMCSLTDRVALLETMLKEQGVEAPPAHHPPKTRHAAPEQDTAVDRKLDGQQNIQDQSSPGSQQSPQEYAEMDHIEHDNASPYGEADSAGSPSMLPPPKKDGMVSRLLSTRGHLSFDQLSGRLRYFGPTTNCHVHSELGNPLDSEQQLSEQARRAEKIIRSLPLETYDYLMEMFWTCYNTVIHVLHREAFEQDREAGRSQFYSGFLHVCVLAIGFRHADKERPDIKKISLPQMESTLHREAKYMLDHELERPGGIPTVVAMLLLGDLECGGK